MELPDHWANHPLVLTESAHNDWATSRAWWTDAGLLLRIQRRAGRYADLTREGLYGIGTPEAVARIINKAAPFYGIGRSTVPRGTRRVLRDLLTEDEVDVVSPFESSVAGEWDWLCIDREPSAQPGEDRVEELTGKKGLALAEGAVATAHPYGELKVGEARSRWFGYRGDDGRILAIAGAARRVPGAPWVLGSIGTAPEFRGRGLGAAVTAAVVRAGLAEARYVTLGMYAHNDAARRMYQRIGFTVLQEFESSM
ncbi:MAG: GNAT family N-acetyltransferase [Promicromonosporaceae bacterium]|nr:GNAT family N-acetyltransferase [Promicromonosporaceae bacterium]